jgi:mannose/cellobiose epimerase-like protein (N-acyl-D-glucosamine 2-epimerase family)
MRDRLLNASQKVQRHLLEELVPFWLTHGVDKHFGGFLTYFNARGKPTQETRKFLPAQMGMLFAASTAHRHHLGDGAFLAIAQESIPFLINHLWDDEHAGWHWECERDGTPVDSNKYCYGHAFAIYALSEYTMASGDARGLELAQETYKSLTTLGVDTAHGGFSTVLNESWQPLPNTTDALAPCKSLQDHLLLLAAFTNLFEATGDDRYQDDVRYILELILTHFLAPISGTTVSHRNQDWSPRSTPRPDTGWDYAHEPNSINFGQDLALFNQLEYTGRLLDIGMAQLSPFPQGLIDHCLTLGIDKEHGGVILRQGETNLVDSDKDYRTQAAALLGMLNAYHRFKDEKYFDAFESILTFLLDHMVNHKVGEWASCYHAEGNPKAPHLGDAFKTGATTLHAMVQTELCLARLRG